ncbi:MAG: mandelate racemase/muconate lactonizing enzyme family protein [Candidatus Dormibacteraceae bacterium]
MRITTVETVQAARHDNLLWLRIHTDEGLIGLGETFRDVGSVAEYIHHTAAPYLIGQDPLAIQRHFMTLGGGMSHHAIGSEMRALSAIDIALWDLYGQSVGLPVYRCLGGPVREKVRIYNTCAGPGYNSGQAAAPGQPFATSWGLDNVAGELEDLRMWQTDGRAGDLARSLMAEGITAMKIWPFDQFADETGGQHITPWQMEQALKPFREIREAVGMGMEIAVELHSRWNLPSAIKIAEALEEIRPLWFEDPITMDDPDTLATFARSTRVPTTASETLCGSLAFRQMLDRSAIGIVMFDPGWVGGITESRRVSELAATYHRPVAPHDCTGPVVYTSGTHLCLATANTLIQEGVRAYYRGWYGEVLTSLPIVDAGTVRPPDGPGLGTALRAEFLSRDDVSIRASR